MTPFLEFCLQYPSVIRLEQPKNQFWCGDIPEVPCQTCPNQNIHGICNSFSSHELDYLCSNYPELLV